MTPEAITQYIKESFEGVVVTLNGDDQFFFYDPTGKTPENQRFPFVTLVTGDNYDTDSNLKREGVFRLNIGVGKETFQSLFGKETFSELKPQYDYTILDTILPHPVYGMMFWICVLNPSDNNFETVKGYLNEAYEKVVNF